MQEHCKLRHNRRQDKTTAAIINDSYKYLMELMTNGFVVVTDPIKYAQDQMKRLNKTEKQYNTARLY
jgi:hypothetical protein